MWEWWRRRIGDIADERGGNAIRDVHDFVDADGDCVRGVDAVSADGDHAYVDGELKRVG
jgi:hypothetical protein